MESNETTEAVGPEWTKRYKTKALVICVECNVPVASRFSHEQEVHKFAPPAEENDG